MTEPDRNTPIRVATARMLELTEAIVDENRDGLTREQRALFAVFTAELKHEIAADEPFPFLEGDET